MTLFRSRDRIIVSSGFFVLFGVDVGDCTGVVSADMACGEWTGVASGDIAGVGVVTLIDGGMMCGVLVVLGFAVFGMSMMGVGSESGTKMHGAVFGL